jgi:hypothetical protein
MQAASAVGLESVASEILAAVAAAGSATDEQLSNLHFLYDSHFAKALQIVDQGGVWCFVGASSGRRVYQVQGHSNEHYVVHPAHYCSCQVRAGADHRLPARPPARRSQPTPVCPRSPLQAFFFDVVSKAEAAACKHQLAARLADALNKTRVQTVSDIALGHLLAE